MKRTYILTGAGGHLGRNIVTLLKQRGANIRALLLEGEALLPPLDSGVEIFRGDVRRPETLNALFEGLEASEKVVVHAAAIIDIKSETSPLLYDVNVNGTRNVAEAALRHGVHRFLHVSSVHAIPEAENRRMICEAEQFSPEWVEGGYAKTKAEASALILDYVRRRGLPAVILHPSGILGPMDSGHNHLVTSLREYVNGHIPACPKGGYDLVDVRDVADGVLRAAEHGRVGEAYILSGRYYEMRDVFAMVSALLRRRFRCPSIPRWLALAVAPLMEKWNVRRGKQPLVTRYSVFALTSNANFSHEKASRELGYWPRDLYDTLVDTLAELRPALPARAGLEPA